MSDHNHLIPSPPTPCTHALPYPAAVNPVPTGGETPSLGAWMAWHFLADAFPALPPGLRPFLDSTHVPAPIPRGPRRQVPMGHVPPRSLLWGAAPAATCVGIWRHVGGPVAAMTPLKTFDTRRCRGMDWHRTAGWRTTVESYGRQAILDEQYNISTSWVKRRCEGCGPGGDWAVRLTAGLRSDAVLTERTNTDTISFVLYIATEDGGPVVLKAPPPYAELTAPGKQHFRTHPRD